MAKKPVSKNEQRSANTHSTRAISFVPETANQEELSFELIITTEAPVRTYCSDMSGSYREVDEILLMSGYNASRSDRLPLIDGHDTYSGIDKILGRVDEIRADGDKLIGKAFVRPGKADIFKDISGGFLGQVSAGYVVNKYDIDETTSPATYRATDWTLIEASLVPIAADPNAFVRSFQNKREFQETPMTLDEFIAALKAGTTMLADFDKSTATAEQLADLKAGEDAIDAFLGETETETTDQTTAATAEESAKAEARALAKQYGARALQVVADLDKLGATAAELKTAVRSAILASPGARAVDVSVPAGAQPVKPTPQRSTPKFGDPYEKIRNFKAGK